MIRGTLSRAPSPLERRLAQTTSDDYAGREQPGGQIRAEHFFTVSRTVQYSNSALRYYHTIFLSQSKWVGYRGRYFIMRCIVAGILRGNRQEIPMFIRRY